MVPAALLVLAVGLHALLLWRIGAHRLDLDHDSTISYLAATGHQGDYERLHLNTWIPAREIQRLFEIDEAWPLRRIRDDLARTDIHPPLYFWLLHAQLLATGATPWASLILNGLLGVLTLLTVYSIGRRLWDRESAAGTALLWVVSYGALLTASEARPYVLTALLSAVLIRLVIAVQDQEGRPSLAQGVLLTVVMLLGLLTHYHFPLMIAAVGTGLLLDGGGGGRQRLMALVPLPLVALGVFALIHPAFASSLERQRLQAQPFTWDDLLPRLKHFLLGLEGLARPGHSHPYLAWLCALVLAWVGLRAYRAGALRRLPGAWGRLRAGSPAVMLVVWCALSYTIFEALLYAGHVTPAHAVGGRYNAALWPLLALLVGGAVRDLSRDRAALPLLAIAVGLLSYQVAGGMDEAQQRLARSPAWQALSSARAIVADHFQRGILPRTARRVPAETPVWVVRDSMDISSLPGEWSGTGVPVTFLLHRELGDARVRQALESAAIAGDSVVSAGLVPGGTEVVVWTPVRLRTGAAAGR